MNYIDKKDLRRYCIGDTVTIVDYLSLTDDFKFGVHEDMLAYAGKTAIITNVEDSAEPYCVIYTIDLDGGFFMWSISMFKRYTSKFNNFIYL